MPCATREEQRACERRSYRKHKTARLARNKEWSDANKEKHHNLVNTWVKNRYKERKAHIDKIKSVPCQDCGNSFPPVCMDLDHRDQAAKSFTIAGGLTKNWEVVLAEIAKCDVVCSNCHRLRTHAKDQYHVYKKNK